MDEVLLDSVAGVPSRSTEEGLKLKMWVCHARALYASVRTSLRGFPVLLVWLQACTCSLVYAQDSPASLELVVLGSGGPGATGRAASSYLVLLDGDARILLDAGPGGFARLGEAKLSLEKTDLVLLTHLHIDHAGELAGLFKARAVSSSHPIVFNVWGPEGAGRAASRSLFPLHHPLSRAAVRTPGCIRLFEGFLRTHHHTPARPSRSG